MWTQCDTSKGGYDRWERKDGAVVLYQHSPYTHYNDKRGRLWIAFPPNSELAMQRPCGRWRRDMHGNEVRLGTPRRWKTAQAAMAAVDKEFPCAG